MNIALKNREWSKGTRNDKSITSAGLGRLFPAKLLSCFLLIIQTFFSFAFAYNAKEPLALVMASDVSF